MMMAANGTELRTVEQLEAEITVMRVRVREINDQMHALRVERDALIEKRHALTDEVLEALGRELKTAQRSTKGRSDNECE